jgi:hypothetical protein
MQAKFVVIPTMRLFPSYITRGCGKAHCLNHSFTGHSVLEIMSCGALEYWPVGGDVVDKDEDIKPLKDDTEEWAAVFGGSHSAADGSDSDQPPLVTEHRVMKKRGRKPGPRPGPSASHVEAERQRREKLNRPFCDLRAAVPTVPRMDKASLLADATAYIAELHGRVEQLQARQAAAAKQSGNGGLLLQEKLEVRMVGRETAALRLTTTAARHAPTRLMGALRSLDLVVQHACIVSRVGGDNATTVQDAFVAVPAALQDGVCLRAALLHVLEQDNS